MAYPQGAYLAGNHLHIPKLGRVTIRLSRPFSGTMKTVTLKKTPTHKYYVSILVDDQHPLPKPIQELNLVSGVDVGLNHLATVVSATAITKYENPRFYAHYLPKLRHAQRSLSRKKKGSHRYRQQRKRVARVHEQVVNARHDYLHNSSTGDQRLLGCHGSLRPHTELRFLVCRKVNTKWYRGCQTGCLELSCIAPECPAVFDETSGPDH